jgi:hypothetical protein
MSNTESRKRPEKPSKASKAVDLGAGVVGTAVTISGVALGGPLGAFAGPFATAGFKALARRFLGLEATFVNVGKDFEARALTPLNKRLVDVAYVAAVRTLGERLEGGEGLRDDGFFPAESADEFESPAEMALAAVLAAAQDSHDTKKAERLGELFSWIAMHPEIGPSHANLLIELAGRLTYTQMLLLGILANKDLKPTLPDWQSTGSFTPNEMNLVAQMEGLAREGLVVRDDNRVISTFTDINPQRLKTVLNGLRLVEAMHLQAAEEADFDELTRGLRLLGKIAKEEGQDEVREQMDMVVPPGKPPDVNRVELAHQVVEVPPRRPTLKLTERDGSAK